MNGGSTVTSFRSILDKPLNQLTEDDISQLTREDCRRFLKDKGMRRPSWNKSQAIQQVISLKALLEPIDDDLPAPVGVSSAIHHHHHHHPQPPRGNLNEAPEKGSDPDDTGFHTAEDLNKSTSTAAEIHTETNDVNVVKPSGGCAASGSFGQMTIFYCGKVNVYDGVSSDKARSIMQLAACPSSFPQDNLLNKNAAVWASPCNIPIDKDVLFPNDTAILQVAQTDKMVEYPLQFREKGSIARDADVEGQPNFFLPTGGHTCMQLTLEPLLVMEVMSLFFLVTGNPAEDLRPVNGVAKLACTGARLTVVTAAEEIKAIFLLFLLSSPSTSSSQPLNWDIQFYDQLQNQIGGGKPKMRWYFKEHGWPSSTLFETPPTNDDDRAKLIDTLQDWKTERYKDIIKSGSVKPRPGVLRLMDEARDAGKKLAVCSAATKSSVILCLENLIGIERFQSLDCFLAGDDVKEKKPDPSIYLAASKKLGISEKNCLVVEDSVIGLQAASKAGMSCVITYTSSTAEQDFKEAIAIYPDLSNVSLKDLELLLQDTVAAK